MSKLEWGLNPVHVGKLWLIAEALEHPVDWFFDVPSAASPDVQVTRKAQKFCKALHALGPRQIQIVAETARALAHDDTKCTKRPRPKRVEDCASHQRVAR